MTVNADAVNNCCIKFNDINARIGEISSPPIGGIKPLNRFRYGSVIEQSVLTIGLLLSILGNQVKRTLMIRRKE